MRQFLIILALSFVILAAGGLYKVKHSVENRRAHLAALEQQILDDSEAVRVLEAEWAYLASPQALQDVSVRTLSLRPVTPDQVLASLTSLPYRMEGRLLAQVTPDKRVGDDVFHVPSPRHKPVAPALPQPEAPQVETPDRYAAADHRLMAADLQAAVNRAAFKVRAPSPAEVETKRDPVDFAARIQRSLDQIGGQR
ncbi:MULTISPECIES: hypothetical protein [unclassified Iodidimonas]|jgi:hypothetical protein|uniref:cell division protein FtsL n=1 Tax=unclassified Iodidimonas TaxID=2626145 RepID=UPI0024825709|nr:MULTISPECIES: hypothetical protein [unclassified Iodidimonas]